MGTPSHTLVASWCLLSGKAAASQLTNLEAMRLVRCVWPCINWSPVSHGMEQGRCVAKIALVQQESPQEERIYNLQRPSQTALGAVDLHITGAQ